MSPASSSDVAASLCTMGYAPHHAARLLAGRPLVSVSPYLADVALARGPRLIRPPRRAHSVPLPPTGCWWSTSNRALVVEAIVGGHTTVEAVLERYGVTRAEVEAWVRACVNAGWDRGMAGQEAA